MKYAAEQNPDYMCFKGPGVDHNSVHFVADSKSVQAERVRLMLERAYEAGRNDKAMEIRRAIGACKC